MTNSFEWLCPSSHRQFNREQATVGKQPGGCLARIISDVKMFLTALNVPESLNWHHIQLFTTSCLVTWMDMQELANKQKKEKEVADLDEDAAKRRQRVALWQEQRRAAEQAEDAERKKREEAAETWTLEDDMENEFGQVIYYPSISIASCLISQAISSQTLASGQAWICFTYKCLVPCASYCRQSITLESLICAWICFGREYWPFLNCCNTAKVSAFQLGLRASVL